jgi:hypothetical protein
MINDKKKSDKKVKDDFYDRINYYESRNIFSTNEPFDPGNRVYTDHAANSHKVWEKINRPSNLNYTEDPIQVDNSNQMKSEINNKSQFMDNLLSSISKLNTIQNNAPVGCVKCGYGI